jgi:hypothetical protein
MDDPLAIVSFGIWLMAAGMYPVGFLFGVCSACCCSNTTCDGFDLEEVYGLRTSGTQVCSVVMAAGATTFTLPNTNTNRRFHEGCRITGDGIAPMTFITNKASGSPLTFTFDPPTTAAVNGCIRICGRGGMCSVSHEPSGEGCGVFGTGASGFDECENDPPDAVEDCGTWKRRRSCIRWICRCYASTGERSNGSQDVAEWYTVISTTVLGGPTVNDLDLPDELETRQCYGESVEHHYLRSDLGNFLIGDAGAVGCIVYAVTFYGWVADCETTQTGTPTQHESRDDCFEFSACRRCDPAV